MLVRQARAFHAKKRLGQNFLVDPEALEKIADALDLKAGDRVLEIGPGLGFLTQYLTDKADVCAVELDRECVAHLTQRGFPNLTVCHEDFLRYDLGKHDGRLKVVGNVPYQITTPILAYLFGELGAPKPWLANIDQVILTVQLEVAERFVARPDTRAYSQITILTNYFSECELLFKLGPESFVPQPKVDSAVVRFRPLKQPRVTCSNTRLLRQIVKAGFSQRRKMLRNNLSFLRCTAQELDSVFESLKLDPQTRAERLSLEQFAKLTDAFDQVRTKS